MDVCVLENNDDDIDWGDCDELRCLFDQILMVLLRGVNAKNVIRPIPVLLGDGRPVDLFKLFCLVRDRGGFRSVSEDKLWGLIAEKFGFDYGLCSSLKLIYFKYLDELDQWLNRITRDSNSIRVRVSEDGGGGVLSILSLELEKRFRNVVGSSDETQCDEFGAKASIIQDVCGRKRKRGVFVEMLSWMTNVSRNPNRFLKGKGNQDRDFLSIALSVREARLHRHQRVSYSNDDQSTLLQKKNKVHPSMYEISDEGVRSSKRLLSLVKAPRCHCCKSTSDNQCKSKSPSSKPSSEKKPRIKEEHVNDLPTSKKVVVDVVPVDDDIVNQVLVGSRFQADVPIWTGFPSESDPKWVGTQIWVPDDENGLLGKGRLNICKCPFPSSRECHRFHIAESRFNLRKTIGLAFYYWKFDRMGEEVSLSWTPSDEMKFKHVMRLNIPNLGTSCFPKKTRIDLVSYYFNVYLINRRSYQNRVTPKEIDSDDDEKEFGSVSEVFGYNAVKVPESKPVACFLNEQAIDFD